MIKEIFSIFNSFLPAAGRYRRGGFSLKEGQGRFYPVPLF
jgi:hypothetical protein